MIIFLYGPDDYRRLQKKREIIGEFKKKHSDLGIGFFDATVSDAADSLEEFLRSQSIFETKKLAVIENLFPQRKSSAGDEEEEVRSQKSEEQEETKKDKKRTVAEVIKDFATTANTTILVSENKKATKPYAFLTKEPAIAQEFAALTGTPWEAFVKSEAKKIGASLALDAIQFLAKVHEGNAWALATELQKLAGFSGAVSVKDLDALGLDTAPNYWALMNGIKSYDIRARLAALEELFAMSDPAPKLFNILASQWKEKTAQFAGYDLAIKSGKLEFEEALVDAVL